MNNDLILILNAASFAADKHRNQRRKDAEASPYINHPLALADILAREGDVDDAQVIAAALLHDTVEDTETTIEEVEAQFGKRVASIIAEVTDDKSLPKEERKRLQVVKSSTKSHGAKLVKLADKIANLRDLIAAPPADWSLNAAFNISNGHAKSSKVSEDVTLRSKLRWMRPTGAERHQCSPRVSPRDKYWMTRPAFLELFNERPEIQKMREATEFTVETTVETDLSLLAIGHSYASSDQLQKRWYRSIRATDERVLWLFQSEEDAIQFACKFGGHLRGSISISAWHRERP